MHGGGRRGKATFSPPLNLTKRQKCSSNFVTDCSIEGSESNNDVRFLIGEECSKYCKQTPYDIFGISTLWGRLRNLWIYSTV